MNAETIAYYNRLAVIASTDRDPNRRRAAIAELTQATANGAAEARAAESQGGGRPLPHVQQAMQRQPMVDPLRYDGRGPQVPQNTVHLDQVHPPILGQYITPMIPPSRIITFPDLPVDLPPGDTSDKARLDFDAAGGCDNAIIIGMHGCVVDTEPGIEAAGDYEYATCELQLTFNDSENLITDGEAASFVPYCDLFSPGDRSMFPLVRAISATDKMFATWRNTQPVATGRPITPSLTLFLLRVPYPGTAPNS